MQAFINRQLSYGVKNKITSEAYSSILYLHVIFNRLTTKAGKVNTKGNKALGVTSTYHLYVVCTM